MAITYKPPESQASDKRTPVTFYTKPTGGLYPGSETEGKELFFCMAEMYSSSSKDHEVLDSVNVKHAITIIIPNPGIDYQPSTDERFEVENLLYRGVTFDIESVAPDGLRDIKIVGAAYAD